MDWKSPRRGRFQNIRHHQTLIGEEIGKAKKFLRRPGQGIGEFSGLLRRRGFKFVRHGSPPLYIRAKTEDLL
jgi:hypothetical protein